MMRLRATTLKRMDRSNDARMAAPLGPPRTDAACGYLTKAPATSATSASAPDTDATIRCRCRSSSK